MCGIGREKNQLLVLLVYSWNAENVKIELFPVINDENVYNEQRFRGSKSFLTADFMEIFDKICKMLLNHGWMKCPVHELSWDNYMLDKIILCGHKMLCERSDCSINNLFLKKNLRGFLMISKRTIKNAFFNNLSHLLLSFFPLNLLFQNLNLFPFSSATQNIVWTVNIYF